MSTVMEQLESRNAMLKLVLAELVPMAILEREQSVWGGPTPSDYATAEEWKRRHEDDPEFMMPFLGYGPGRGWLNMLVKVLVVMAFQTGGIKIFGSHFVGGQENREATAEVYGKQAGRLGIA